MINYFANGNQLNAFKGVPTQDSLTGTLISFDPEKKGQCSSGYWLVVQIKNHNDIYSVHFDRANCCQSDISRLNSLWGKIVTLSTNNGRPVIMTKDIECEESLRANLLRGVSAGNIKIEDLPTLIDFVRGKDIPSPQQQLDDSYSKNNNLKKELEKVTKDNNKLLEEINNLKETNKNLWGIREEVLAEEEKLQSQILSAIQVLEGDELVHDRNTFFPNQDNDKFVYLRDGAHTLAPILEDLRYKKEVFVLCGEEVHRVHHVYHVHHGQVILVGDRKPIKRKKPEEFYRYLEAMQSKPEPPQKTCDD